MQRAYQYISVERTGNIFCVSLQQPYVADEQLEELGAELNRLIDVENCHKMVLNLGPDEPDCLYSVFFAKLINLHERLHDLGGGLALAHVSEHVRALFRAAGIEKFFHFFPDQQSAVQALNSHP